MALISTLRIGRFSGVLLWILLIAVFAVWQGSTFLDATTWDSIADTGAITAVLAIALTFPLAAGVYDLAAAQTLGLTAVVIGTLLDKQHHVPIVIVILLAIALGAVIGLVNAFLTVIVGIDSFIATLGMSSLLLAAAELIGNGQFLGPFPGGFTGLTSAQPLGLPVLLLYVLGFAAIAWAGLEHTAMGRRIYAVGANAEAARLAGVRTKRYVFAVFIISGLGAAVAGVLLASSTNSANSTLGPAYLLPAFAAVFLGSTQLKPGRVNIWGTVLAIYLLGTGIEGIQLAGGTVWVTDLFNGAALLIAVGSAVVIERRRRAPRVSTEALRDEN